MGLLRSVGQEIYTKRWISDNDEYTKHKQAEAMYLEAQPKALHGQCRAYTRQTSKRRQARWVFSKICQDGSLSKTRLCPWLFQSYLQVRQTDTNTIARLIRLGAFFLSSQQSCVVEYFVERLEKTDFSLITTAVFSDEICHLIVERFNNVGKPFDPRSRTLARRQEHFHGILMTE